MTKIHWNRFGSPVEYGRTGSHRVTYWLRLGKDVRKVTNATPSALEWAWAHRRPAASYEAYAFGSALIREDV